MLLTGKGASTRTSKIQLVSEFCGKELKLHDIENMGETKSESYLKKNPNGKIPILETSDGVLYESNAIMRHVARLSGHNSVMGKDSFSHGQVEQYIDMIANELEAGCSVIQYTIFGYLDIEESTLKTANADIANCLRIFNDLLKTN